MKYIVILLILDLLFIGEINSQQSPAQILSDRIAMRMKDSLGLSNAQKDSIFAINQLLHSRKMVARQQYTDPDSLRSHLQKIENTRNSLYSPVLGEEKYLLYRQKKKYLVSGN